MAGLSEFEVRRYQKIGITFVAIYEECGELEAGQYAARELRIEELPLARKFVVDAFLDAGYQFDVEFLDWDVDDEQ